MINISVVIPCFNSQDSIVKCIESVLKQTLLPSEIICVDDGSNDDTVKIISEIKEKNSDILYIKIILQPNSGPSVARNVGVENSMSDYIAFLDSDDIWHPKKLELSSKAILDFNLDFIYHLYSPFTPSFDVDIDKFFIKSRRKSEFAFKNFIATPTVIIKKNIFCGFPEHISYCEDYCCWLLTDQKEFFYIDLPLANGFKKPLGESGLSSNVFRMHRGFVDALFYLKKEKKISLFFFLIAYIFEYIKFPLRYLR